MDLVDEEDGAFGRLQLLHHRLQALLEVAAIARAGQQRAHVEREDGGVLQHVRHVLVDDAARQALGDRGLADARIADIERVVLGAAAQHLDGAVDLLLAPDQRVDAAVLGLLVEVDAVGLERIAAGLDPASAFRFGIGATHAPRLGPAGRLGDAVADVVDGVEPRHLLLLQEEHGVALALGEQRDQDVGAGHLFAAGGLHVDGGALQHALEAGGRLGFGMVAADDVAELVVDIVAEVAAQPLDIDVAGPHDRDRVLVVDQRQQQVLEGGVVVPPVVGVGEGPAQGLL